MHAYNIVRAVRQREGASGISLPLPVREKEPSTRGDPVSLDIGYRSGRKPLSFCAKECILRIARRTTGSLRFVSLLQDSSQRRNAFYVKDRIVAFTRESVISLLLFR